MLEDIDKAKEIKSTIQSLAENDEEYQLKDTE